MKLKIAYISHVETICLLSKKVPV